MTGSGDREQIARVIDGDAEAFGYFIGRYGDGVFALVCGIVRNREDAEEITSDVFLKAYSQLHKFRGDSKFSTWIYRIAYNAAISFARKKRIPLSEIDEGRVGDDMADDEGEAILREAELDKLERAMDRLGSEERAITEMFYMEKMSMEEIAEVTAINPGNVKVKLYRTRKRLAELMRDDNQG